MGYSPCGRKELDTTEGLILHFTSLINFFMKMKMLVTQSCPTLCDTIDCSPQGSSVHGILQARILEWVALSFSRGSSLLRDRTGSPALQADFFIV